MGTINFSFLPGNKSRPKTKCNFTFIPGFFSSINFVIPYGNIFLKKKLILPNNNNNKRPLTPKSMPPAGETLTYLWHYFSQSPPLYLPCLPNRHPQEASLSQASYGISLNATYLPIPSILDSGHPTGHVGSQQQHII